MADRDLALERLERRLVEDLGHQAHVLVDQDLAAVADRDAGGLLPAVLQRVETEVGQLGDFFAGGPDAEDAAGVLGSGVLGIEVVGEASISAGHALKCRVSATRMLAVIRDPAHSERMNSTRSRSRRTIAAPAARHLRPAGRRRRASALSGESDVVAVEAAEVPSEARNEVRHVDAHGLPYQTPNEVVEFEQDRRIAWKTTGLNGLVGGRIWRYELEAGRRRHARHGDLGRLAGQAEVPDKRAPAGGDAASDDAVARPSRRAAGEAVLTRHCFGRSQNTKKTAMITRGMPTAIAPTTG